MAYEILRFNWEYHPQPEIYSIDEIDSNLIDIPLTAEEMAVISYYDELARQAAEAAKK